MTLAAVVPASASASASADPLIVAAAIAVPVAAAAAAAVAVESAAVACAVVAALYLRTGGVVVDGVVGTHNLPLTADCCTPNYRSKAAVMS